VIWIEWDVGNAELSFGIGYGAATKSADRIADLNRGPRDDSAGRVGHRSLNGPRPSSLAGCLIAQHKHYDDEQKCGRNDSAPERNTHSSSWSFEELVKSGNLR
jgi:hypothetical protein